ncbi:MAG: geranylgeranyl reductase family protein [Candidatus Bathyarchaeia archaeon]
MEKFDVVVAGAGTGGCLAAKTAAKAGLNVCLIDIKNRENIGKKICGDAIGKHHFDNLGLKEPDGDEIECVMDGVRIYSPDKQTSYVVKGEKLYGYILNRHRFGQRLVKEAVDEGAVLYDAVQVLEPIVKRGFVYGVSTKNLKTGEKNVLQSSLVVEATGFFAAIRKKLPPEIGIDLHVDNRDVEACYREIRRLKQPLNEPNLCQIYLTQTITPGGYHWIFPESGSKVNVGLGIAMSGKFPNPKEQLYRHILSQPLFKDSSIVDKGAWYVPTRRPLDNMVGNGIIIVGDAACQVNPIHGGGMGPSMIGGALAGKTAAKALEKGDVSRGGLWDYNVDYIRSYGAKQAGLEVFRILLQNMDDEELNYGMQYKLLTEEDVLKASMGEDARFSINEKVKRAFRGLKKLGVLNKLRNATKSMREIKAWYRNYPPSPKDFQKWKNETKEIFRKAVAKLEK